MEGYTRWRNRPSTQERCARAFASPDFNAIRALIVTDTRADHFLEVLTAGGNATNHYLRRLHNFALGMGYLLCPVLHAKVWPPVRGKKRRAITAAEHHLIVAAEANNPERQAYYEMLWATGGGQTDIANLTDKNVEWKERILDYARCKLLVDAPHSLMRFGDQMRALLARLPQRGPLFPRIRRTSSNDRAAEFARRCKLLGLRGVSLHSYRYAWVERAAAAGYPERFAQAALGHASKAVHRAYSRKGKVVAPPLESYEDALAGKDNIVSFPPPSRNTDDPATTSEVQKTG